MASYAHCTVGDPPLPVSISPLRPGNALQRQSDTFTRFVCQSAALQINETFPFTTRQICATNNIFEEGLIPR